MNTEGGKWISINDKYPDTDRKVLVDGTPIGVTVAHYWGKTKESDPCKGWSIMGVTEWMEIPAKQPSPALSGEVVSLEECKNEVAINRKFDSWSELYVEYQPSDGIVLADSRAKVFDITGIILHIESEGYITSYDELLKFSI